MATEHEVRVNGHKFKISVRDIVQFVIMALAVIGIYFVADNRLHNVEISVTDLYKKHDGQEREISEIDKNGTKRSHETDAIQQEQINSNIAQIADMNKTLRDLGPKVDKIDTNVLWLMAKQLEKK
jgi:hypothetical protein